MKNSTNKLPKQRTQPLYSFTQAAGQSETSTSADPTTTMCTTLTTTHIWKK